MLVRARFPDRPSRSAGAVKRALVVLAIAGTLASCRGTRRVGIPDVRSPYDVLTPQQLLAFAEARAAFEQGRFDEAAAEFRALCAHAPSNVPAAVWLQEVELAQAALHPDASAAVDELRQRYRTDAEAQPSVVRFVLAARVEPDAPAATLLLGRAEELDADCAWVHYGAAFLAARASDWPGARVRVARASEAEPGHLPARGLEAWLLAQGGDARVGITALERWLARARVDVTIPTSLVRAAEIDLALLYTRDGDPERAAQILAMLPEDASDAGRRLTLRAVTEQELGRDMRALAAAREAEAASPGELLPVVQQALLHDLWLEDPAAAEAAWIRVLGMSRSDRELDGLLELLRARVRLERLQLAREASARRP